MTRESQLMKSAIGLLAVAVTLALPRAAFAQDQTKEGKEEILTS